MFSQVLSLDLELFRLINSEWISPPADFLMALVSDFGIWKWPLIVVGILLLVAGRFRERVLLTLVALSLLIGDVGIVQGIRGVVNRPRPWQAENAVRYVSMEGAEIRHAGPYEEGRSMPSGHTCNNTAAATLLTLLYAPYGWLAWGWVALVSYSRIYTGSHYPSDVLVSIPLAILYAWGIFKGASILWKRLAPRWAPGLFKSHPDLFK